MSSKIWFKRKRYGWGWYPATKEGWGVLLLWLTAFISNEYYFLRDGDESNMQVAKFLGITLLITAGLIIISALKGEKPKWQWGEKRGERDDD